MERTILSRVIISEEEIARQRVGEDLRLYGSRPEPSGAVDIDKSKQLASLQLNGSRSSLEFGAAIDRPAKVRKKGEWNHETVTAVDWNAGAFAPDAWLHQSVRSLAPVIDLTSVFYEVRSSCHFIVRRIRAGYLYLVHRGPQLASGEN